MDSDYMVYDVAILGAGVIGSLTALELSKYNANVCIVDRFPEPACGTSKANSAIVHAGYDPISNTMKAAFNVKGSLMMKDLCLELDVPYIKNGSLVLAFDEHDGEILEKLYKRGIKNTVKNLEIIDRERVLELEPNINPEVISALYAPDAAIVSPYELTVAAAESALDNGVRGLFNFNVTEIKKENNIFRIISDRSEIHSRYLINCAGVYSDIFCGEDNFKIQPRKGEYLILDKKFSNIISHTLFQTPTERGKGILAAPTVHNNLLLGPTSDPVNDKEDTDTTQEGLSRIMSEIKKILPRIELGGVITSFAGLRASSGTNDFLVGWSKSINGMINAAGIDSPGLTAAPAIAQHIASLLLEAGIIKTRKDIFKKRRKIIRMSELSLEEKNNIIKENPSYGRVVCRCECISEGEIIDAIHRNAGACTLDGVKRRVRTGMGRCQGSFCMTKVLEILSRELNIPQTQLTKNGGSSILLSETLKGVK